MVYLCFKGKVGGGDGHLDWMVWFCSDLGSMELFGQENSLAFTQCIPYRGHPFCLKLVVETQIMEGLYEGVISVVLPVFFW